MHEATKVISYDLLVTEDGRIVRESPTDQPISFVAGVSQSPPPKIQQALRDAQPGEVRTVEFPAQNAGAGTRVFRATIRAVRPATPAECAQKRGRFFPLDLFDMGPLPGDAGQTIKRLEPYSLIPPYPWGQWTYAQRLLKICTDVPGDAIELGVASGGTSLLLGHLLKSHGKRVFSLDSYEGLPPPTSQDNRYFLAGDYEGDGPLLERFCGVIEQEGLTNVVIPVKGFFEDTVPKLEQPEHLCFAHLDSDLYDSVYCSLEGVYDRISPGGILIIDDFFHHAQGPARACSAFFNKAQIQPLYHVVFPYAVGIIKGEEPPDDRRRSLDGNIYTFDWLADDPVFRESLELSLDRTVPDSRSRKQARLLIDVLNDNSPSSANIYRYWAALEDFWDGISATRSRDWKIKI